MLGSQLRLRSVVRPEESPIYIIGTGRSGTTLLRQMLNAHPRIHILHESAIYFYRALAPRRAPVSQWLERYFETFSFAWLRLSRDEVRRALFARADATSDAAAVRTLLQCAAEQRGKPRCGDKDPLCTMSLDRIFAEFADPRVIYVSRDPRPTVLSLSRMPWAASGVLLNSLFCRLQFEQTKPYLDRILEVRLEDLAAAPRAVLESVLHFVGEPWDEAVLDHVRRADRADVAPLPWFAAAQEQPPTIEAAERSWRTRLTLAEIHIIEQLTRPILKRYGYPLVDDAAGVGFNQAARAVLAERYKILPALRRALAYRRRLVRHMRGLERYPPQEALAASLQLNPAAWVYYPDLRLPRVP